MEIVERDVSNVIAKPPSQSVTGAFPEVMKVDCATMGGAKAGKKKQSLFARQTERQRREQVTTAHPSPVASDGSRIVDGSGLGRGAAEAVAIHCENAARLAAMSERELVQFQRELLVSIDPALVTFLRSRAHGKMPLQDRSTGSAGEQVSGQATMELEDSKGEAVKQADSLASNAEQKLFTAAECVQENPEAAASPEEVTALKTEVTSSNTACHAEEQPMDVTPPNFQSKHEGPPAKCVRFAGVRAEQTSTEDESGIREMPATEDADMAKLQQVKDQLPIDVEAAARAWPHMDRVEPQKLLWMTELPAPAVDHPQTGYSARFDFNGVLLPFAADAPAQSALYHHGEEPERAGYTVDEMFRLARANVLQQRTLGLNTIANVLNKVKEGRYDGVLEPPLLGRLVEAGLPLLLRFSLDDAAEPVVTAALTALQALVDNQPDEICLDRVFGWSRGVEQPSLPTAVDTEPERRAEYQREEPALKDDAVTRLDVVRGLVRVGTLPRIRYLLEVVRPSAPAVVAALRVLARCARHSLKLATEVADCPRLLDTVCHQFLPVCGAAPLEGAASEAALSCVYGVPLQPAVRLLRVLCSQGAQLAARLVRRHQLLPALLSYVALNPGESGMPSQEVLTLAIESYRLWIVLMHYGIGDEHFIEFFPLLVRQLHFYASTVSVAAVTSAQQRYNHDLGTCLLALCRTAVCSAWSNHQTELLVKTGVDSAVPGAIRWAHVTGLLEPIQQCTHKWISELRASAEPPTDNAVQLLGACCQFLTAYHERWARLGLDDTVQRLQCLQRLCDVTVKPLLTSQLFQTACRRIPEFSSLLSGLSEGGRRDAPALPSVGTVVWGRAEVAPPLRSGSPLPLLTPLLQLVRAACQLHRRLADTLCAPVLEQSALISYLGALSGDDGRRLSLTGDWFTRHEIHLAAELTLLHAQQSTKEGRRRTGWRMHGAGLRLVRCCQRGDEHLCAELLRRVVFNCAFLSGDTSAAASRLVSSCALYERCTLSAPAAAAARDRADTLTGRLATLTVRGVAGATLLPVDWWYAPLVQLYELHNTSSESREAASGCLHGVPAAEVASRCLQLLQLLFTHHRHQLLADVSVTSHFARLCCVFLAGDSLFLEPEVRPALEAVLRQLLQQPQLLDLQAEVPGLASFADLYKQLLEQFEAVSYGDWLFAAVVLVALQPRHPAELRRTVWLERPLLLRSLTTREQQMLVPLEVFLCAPEPDPELRAAYRRAITSGQLHPSRNPALHRIAIALSADQ